MYTLHLFQMCLLLSLMSLPQGLVLFLLRFFPQFLSLFTALFGLPDQLLIFGYLL